MIGVDKDGNFSPQKLDQAKSLLWSFMWAHLSLMLLAVFFTLLLTGGVRLFVSELSFLNLFLGTMQELIKPNVLLIWVAVFAIYPHYWI